MACCVFTAYFMSRIIKACELFDIRLLEIKYNDFDPDSELALGFQPSFPPAVNEQAAYEKATPVNRITDEKASGPLTTTRLLITGMTCAACVSTLTDTLTSHPSVVRTNISLPLSRATIIYNSHESSTDDLIALVEDTGYGAQVLGQGDHGSAAQNLRLVQREEELQDLKRAFNGAAKWATSIAAIDWIQQINAGAKLAGILDPPLQVIALAIGCYVQISHASWIHRNAWSTCFSRKGLQLPNLSMDTLLSLSLLLSIGLSFFNIGLHGLSDPHTKTYFSSASFLTVVISGGRYLDVTLKKQGAAGFARLFGLQREMELGTVMVEGRLRKTESIQGDQQDAVILTPVPTTLLAPLDTYHIPPQGLIPCDSYIVRGSSLIDESNMTGESMPVRKSVGDFLMSGTRNLSHGLVAVVLKDQTESSLEKLVESIETATEMKYDSAQGTDRDMAESMTRHFVSAVLLLTCIGFALTLWRSSPVSLPLSDRINLSCERAMAILAAACPCAIGLANPSAIMAGIDASYAHGILLPGGASVLENLSRLTHIVLDKTGTLTEGKLQIAQTSFAEPFRSDARKRELCYQLLCAAERDEAQTHPVGRAVFQWCLRQLKEQGKADNHVGGLLPTTTSTTTSEAGTAPTRNVSSVLGKGVRAEVQGYNKIWYTVHIGSERFLREHDICVPQHNPGIPPSSRSSSILPPSPATTHGGTTTAVHFALDDRYAGTFTLQDTIRANAPAVIQSLKAMGLALTMLTGDSEAEAHRVSSELGIPVLAAKSLPHEKKELVESLKKRRATEPVSVPVPVTVVAMLGDGLNDAPAQAVADVGIQFSLSPLSRGATTSRQSSSSSTTTALAPLAADAILLTPDLSALPSLLAIARKTTAHARWTTAWAVLYNAVAIALAMGLGDIGGRVNINIDASTAGTMMAVSSISVLAMGLLLRRRLRDV